VNAGVDGEKLVMNFLKKIKPGPQSMPLGPVTTAFPKSQEAKSLIKNMLGDVPSGKIFAKGDASKLLKDKGLLKEKLSPENKNMFNKLMLMHEEIERKAGKKAKELVNFNTHGSPDVILRESNLLATLPKEHQALKDVFKTVRNLDQTKNILENSIKGFRYGGQRYSRHARKRMNEILKEKGIKPLNEKELLEVMG
jgi:hypothetical protein